MRNEDYLGIEIFRFFIRCPGCSNEITFKTDPQNADYICEHGASRNFESWREEDEANAQLSYRKKLEEKLDPMKALENTTVDSKREIDILDALDEIRTRNAMTERVHVDAVLDTINTRVDAEVVAEVERRRREEEEDEAAARAVFRTVAAADGTAVVVKRLLVEDEEELERQNDDGLSHASTSNSAAVFGGLLNNKRARGEHATDVGSSYGVEGSVSAAAAAARDTQLMPPPPLPAKKLVAASLGIVKKGSSASATANGSSANGSSTSGLGSSANGLTSAAAQRPSTKVSSALSALVSAYDDSSDDDDGE